MSELNIVKAGRDRMAVSVHPGKKRGVARQDTTYLQRQYLVSLCLFSVIGILPFCSHNTPPPPDWTPTLGWGRRNPILSDERERLYKPTLIRQNLSALPSSFDVTIARTKTQIGKIFNHKFCKILHTLCLSPFM